MSARLPFAALMAAALLLAPLRAAGAQDTGRPKAQPSIVLRGAQQPDATAPPAAAQAPAAAAPVPDRLSGLDPKPAPGFSYDPAPRQAGLSVAPGGAQCRQACARTLYACRVSDDEEGCNPQWSQCVAACPEGSSDF